VSTAAENRRNHNWEAGMKVQRRDFLLLVTLAAAAATPALGQAVTPAAGPAKSDTHTAASIPDFSGLWSHPYFPGFEPPASGPGPVTNRLRLGAEPQRGVSNPNQLVGDYTNPILKPQAAEAVKKHGEIELSVGAPTPMNQCWPEGVPFVFRDVGMQMLQQRDGITILYVLDQQVRHVRMNQPHPAHVTPSWYGDSVGYYEGDTLVIDTVGVKLGPFAMVDMYGTPYTQALHVVERYRLLDYEAAREGLERAAKENFRVPPDAIYFDCDPNYRGKHLQLQFTVEDDGVFTTPWSATITYGHSTDDWPEMVCAENTRSSYAGQDTAVPTADKPDF
jgi:hypothetical protein